MVFGTSYRRQASGSSETNCPAKTGQTTVVCSRVTGLALFRIVEASIRVVHHHRRADLRSPFDNRLPCSKRLVIHDDTWVFSRCLHIFLL